MSTLHSHRSYANVHLYHEATTLHISTCTRIEVAPIFALSHIKTSFAPKPCQHPSLPWSHDNTSFILKSCQHPSFPWSHDNTSFVLKPCQHSWSHVKTLFAPKPCQHPSLPWSHDNTSFILKSCQHSWSHVKTLFAPTPCQHSWSHEVTSTLHISTGVMPILVFAMKLRQHFIRTKAVPTFMKPYQYFICTKVVPTSIFAMKSWQHSTLAQIFRSNIAYTSRVYSTVAKHQDFRDANKTSKMQGVPTKTLKMQENANKTLKMREKWRQTFEDARVCCEDFEDVKTCHQEFWHCTNMPIEERWCNIDFGYIIYHHSGGS